MTIHEPAHDAPKAFQGHGPTAQAGTCRLVQQYPEEAKELERSGWAG
jgi:hypothetical protein